MDSADSGFKHVSDELENDRSPEKNKSHNQISYNISESQHSIRNVDPQNINLPSKKNEHLIFQTKYCIHNELPPIIEFQKVMLNGKPKLKELDSDCTRSLLSDDLEPDDMRNNIYHDRTVNMMVTNSLAYNINNHPRFLSQSVDRIITRLAFQNGNE